MAFDVRGALKDGYSAKEIADFLAQDGGAGFDVAGARKDGYSDEEIVSFLAEENKTWGDTATKAAENFLPSLGQAAKDFVQPILHPIDTLSGVKNVALGYGEKLNRMVQENSGQYEEGEIVPGEHEKYADALNKHFDDRYGSFEKARKTLEEDPAGLLLDVGSLATLGGGALTKGAKAGSLASKAGKALDVTGKALDPLTLPAMAAKKAGGAVRNTVGPVVNDVLTVLKPTSLERKYAALLKPSSSLDPEQFQRVTQIGLENKIAPTMEGWNDFITLREKTENQLGEVLRNASEAQAAGQMPMLDMRPLIQRARDQVKGSMIYDVDGQALMSKVDEIADNANAMFANPVDMVTADNIKRRQQKKAKKLYGKDGIHPAAEEFEAALASIVREEMEKMSPDVAVLNKKLHDLHVLEEALTNAVNGNFKRDNIGGVFGNVGLGTLGGGSVGGAPGAAVGMVAGKLLKDPNIAARKIFKAYEKQNAPQKPQSKVAKATTKSLQAMNKGARAMWKALPDEYSGRALQYQAGKASLLDLLEDEY